MKIYKIILLITAAIFIAFFLTINIYFNGDIPMYSGKIAVGGITDTVEVYTDEYGMPYIFAKNNEDLFCTIGYTMAKDRLFQLSLIKAIVNGNIADILGDDYLEHDQYIKSNRQSKEEFAIDDEYRALLESFCRGINSYIDDNPTGNSVSFKIANSTPIKWVPSDVVSAIDLMVNNNLADLNNLTVQNAVNKYYGESHSFDINVVNSQANSNLTNSEMILEYEIMDLIGASGSPVGSAGYIVHASLTTDKKAVFIFNDNWGYRQPTKWFDIHLNGGDFNVSGSTVVGFPLPLVGRNQTTVYANLGNAPNEIINAIFEIAKNSPTNNFPSLFVADTSGNYNDAIVSDLYDKIDNLDKLNIEDILKKYHQNDNSNKVSLFNFLISNYVDLDKYPELVVLANWDGDESITSDTALLANIILKNLVESIFLDELSLIDDDLYSLFLRNTKLVDSALENVIRNSESSWIDDINTINYTEEIADIVNKAAHNSLIEIKRKYGRTNYKWGKVNPPSFEHILANKRASKFCINFNTKLLSRKGSNKSRVVQEFIYDDNLTPLSTTVMTKVFDLSDLGVTYSRLLPGQSGNPSSMHYSNQIDLYANSSFREISTNEDAIRNSDSFQHLILYPSE